MLFRIIFFLILSGVTGFLLYNSYVIYSESGILAKHVASINNKISRLNGSYKKLLHQKKEDDRHILFIKKYKSSIKFLEGIANLPFKDFALRQVSYDWSYMDIRVYFAKVSLIGRFEKSLKQKGLKIMPKKFEAQANSGVVMDYLFYYGFDY